MLGSAKLSQQRLQVNSTGTSPKDLLQVHATKLRCSGSFKTLEILTKLVITVFLVRITQYIKCTLHLLETLLGTDIVRIHIWMVLASHFPVSPGNLILRSAPGDTENLVIVVTHNRPCGKNATRFSHH